MNTANTDIKLYCIFHIEFKDIGFITNKNENIIDMPDVTFAGFAACLVTVPIWRIREEGDLTGTRARQTNLVRDHTRMSHNPIGRSRESSPSVILQHFCDL